MKKINIPDEVHQALANGADLLVSISGGKDSQAMLAALAGLDRIYPGEILAIHADLGRMEWQQSLKMCQRQCDDLGIKLIVVHRQKGDLLVQIKERQAKLDGTGKPFWPSPARRYCTSDQKRDQIDKYIRGHHKQVVVATGFRREESPARSKHLPCSLRKRVSGAAVKRQGLQAVEAWDPGQGRLGLDWYPILDWLEADVWQACGTSTAQINEMRSNYKAGYKSFIDHMPLPVHPAYIFGNERVSCALCIMASENDLINGARHNPEIFNELLNLERSTGCTFQHSRSLEDIFIKLECEK